MIFNGILSTIALLSAIDSVTVATDSVAVCDSIVVEVPDTLVVPPPFLLIEGLSSTTENFSGTGERKEIRINTNIPLWIPEDNIPWCRIMALSDTSMTLFCQPNPRKMSRHSYIKINGGSEAGECRLTVIQGIAPENFLSGRGWTSAMAEVLSGRYRGQSFDGVRAGLGASYIEESDIYHWGTWVEGERSGNALILASDSKHISECPDALYYVGNLHSGLKQGTGTCYDRFGSVIYHGDFKDDVPLDRYPTPDNYMNYRFECVKYSNGTMYIGETYEGIRQGYGIQLQADGSAWYGHWQEGQRSGYGMEIPGSGNVRVGYWSGDSYVGNQ